MPPACGVGSPTSSRIFTTTTDSAIIPSTMSVITIGRRIAGETRSRERSGGGVLHRRAVEPERLAHRVGGVVRLAARREATRAHVVGEALDRASRVATQVGVP